MLDNDWPTKLRKVTDDEEKRFPKHGKIDPPDKEHAPKQIRELKRQKDHEKVHGHPAHKSKVPDEEPIDHTPYKD